MRISFLTPEYVTESDSFDGGLSAYLFKIANILKNHGHEPVIIVGASKCETLFCDGIKVIRVDVQNRFINLCQHYLPTSIGAVFQYFIRWLFQSWKLNRALIREHRSNPFDVAQYASYTATCIFRPPGIPAIIRISSYQPAWFQEYDRDMSSIAMRTATWLENASLRKADAVYSPSKAIASLITKRVGIEVNVIEPSFIPSEVKTDDSVYATKLRNTTYLLFFGTFGKLKGALEISAILPQLLVDYPEIVFAIAGKDSRIGKTSAVKAIMERTCHNSRVLYLGKLTRDQLFPVVQNSHIVILPSRIDNLPNSCIEAMNQGKVVIGTNGTSFEQLIIDGENGILCEPANAPSLYSAIRKALSMSEESLKIMGEKAHRTTNRLRPENTLPYFIDFCKSIVSRKQAGLTTP